MDLKQQSALHLTDLFKNLHVLVVDNVFLFVQQVHSPTKTTYLSLGYIRLGQSSTTLSGGEAQRVKLDKQDVIKVAQVAPGVRVSIAEEFGAEIGTFEEGKIVTALKMAGFDYVFDVNNAADFTVIEEANELIQKLETGKGLPLFTSCCPGWFSYCKQFYPEFFGNLSTSKSPNEMLGSLVKYFFEQQGKKVEIVSVMPCTGKKKEIRIHGVIDTVITTRELGDLIKLKNINFNALEGTKI